MIQRYDFAPLDGITKVVFRQVYHRMFGGADRYFIPFFSPTDQHILTKRDQRELDPAANAGLPVVPQVMTRRAEDFLWAAEVLEDLGYLPRMAYNLDRCFARCGACGKQALTMCMGLSCNAAGVVGCRIIDSERERLLAVLTNSLMPCNGRFPALIALMTMFFAAASGSSLVSALLLTAALVLSVGLTFGATWLLSVTVLRGRPSAFALELPPYRAPQVGQVIVRSVLDRTLFVLGRAAAVAAPAGMILWTLANGRIGGVSLLARCAGALDPLGRAMGMDGVLLLAFVLGFPANEIVLPIAVMGYLAQGSLDDSLGLAQMHALLTANGWTWTTAVSAVLFFLLHWPCSTTLWTIRRETGSAKWTLLAALLPTAMGMALCTAFTALARALGW